MGETLTADRRDGEALPPGPRIPSSLQGLGWAQRPLPFLERCQKRYGDLFTLRVRHGGTWVVVCDPQDVKRVFTADPSSLGVAEANTLLGPVLGSRSVMLLEEPDHMRRRKLMLPPFHGKRIDGYAKMVSDVTHEQLQAWPLSEPLELWPRMQAITLDVVMQIVFGATETSSLVRLRGLLRDLTERMNEPRRLGLLALLGPRLMVRGGDLREAMSQVEEAVLAEVARRATDDRDDAPPQAGEPARATQQDIVSLLREARYEDGSPMSAQDLRDELITLLLDGPTSTSLAWTLERLMRHPDKLARVREEIAVGDEDRYLDAVVKETLRLCPPVPIVARRLEVPMELSGRVLPAGTIVAPCIHLLHRREDVYPYARSFLPERFLAEAPGTYTWIPFGGGVRRCLAASFALLEMKRVIATVLGELELRPVESRSEHISKSAISLSPGRRGLAIVTRRAPARKAPGARPAVARIPRLAAT